MLRELDFNLAFPIGSRIRRKINFQRSCHRMNFDSLNGWKFLKSRSTLSHFEWMRPKSKVGVVVVVHSICLSFLVKSLCWLVLKLHAYEVGFFHLFFFIHYNLLYIHNFIFNAWQKNLPTNRIHRFFWINIKLMVNKRLLLIYWLLCSLYFFQMML